MNVTIWLQPTDDLAVLGVKPRKVLYLGPATRPNGSLSKRLPRCNFPGYSRVSDLDGERVRRVRTDRLTIEVER